MKKVNYPNLNDYDLSAYEELKGDVLYTINGGVTMSPEDQKNMADAAKNGDNETQKEIIAKYEKKETPVTPPANTQTPPPDTNTTPQQTTALTTEQQVEEAKKDADKKKKSGSSGSSSGNGSGSGSGNTNDGASGSPGATKGNGSANPYEGRKTSLTNEEQYEMARKDAERKNNEISAKAPEAYSIDEKTKTVRADLNNYENMVDAYSAYYLLGDRGYTFELADNGKVIHAFNDTDTVKHYLEMERNWGRNKYLNNCVLTLKEADLRTNPDLNDEERLIRLEPSESAFHLQGTSKKYDPSKNVKYVSVDGHQEYVFNELGQLVTDPVNRGTYNYCSHKENPVGHFFNDIVPWIKFGTGYDDPTTPLQRLMSTVTLGAYKYQGPVD